MQIVSVQKFIVEGQEFNSRAEAIAYGQFKKRFDAIDALPFPFKTDHVSIIGSDTGADWEVVTCENLAAFLAQNGDLLISLLTIPVEKKTRKPRQAKVPATA